MLEIKNLHKNYKDKRVLENICFSCNQAEVTMIIGASGSGKTTLLKTIVGLEIPNKGSVFYNCNNFTDQSFSIKTKMRQQIGMLFQGVALFDSLTIGQNLMLPLNMFSSLNKKEKQERVNFCLSKVNLENITNKYPCELSGGMQKRAGLARALVLNPKYLFCDEPNSGLDPLTSNIINNLIRNITREFNMTTLVITHDMNSVLQIADKIIFLHNGKKWWEGNKQQVLSSNNEELNHFVTAGCIINLSK